VGRRGKGSPSPLGKGLGRDPRKFFVYFVENTIFWRILTRLFLKSYDKWGVLTCSSSVRHCLGACVKYHCLWLSWHLHPNKTKVSPWGLVLRCSCTCWVIWWVLPIYFFFVSSTRVQVATVDSILRSEYQRATVRVSRKAVPCWPLGFSMMQSI